MRMHQMLVLYRPNCFHLVHRHYPLVRRVHRSSFLVRTSWEQSLTKVAPVTNVAIENPSAFNSVSIGTF